MSDELKVLELVSSRLEQLTIPYMITSSVALNYYATPRMTRDIDLIVELRKEDISKLTQLFSHDFYIDDEMIAQAMHDQSMFNIIHNEWIIKVDFIIRKASTYRLLEFKRRQKVDMGHFSFWVVSPEDLVLSKLVWAKDSLSDLQLRDVKSLFNMKEDLDYDYIEKWVANLKLETVYAKVSEINNE